MSLNSAYVLIHESDHSKVYHLAQSAYQQPVAVKVLKKESSNAAGAIRLKNEYELTQALEIEGVRKALGIIEIEEKPALVMAYFPGITLKQMVAEKMAVIEGLQIALRIAQIIGNVHNEKIIHGKIESKNILIDPETRQVQLIDFGLASRFGVQIDYSGTFEIVPGDLCYISPEQTGRMNRIVDYRTDIYSFGVVLYEILTGAPPFESDDPLALVHAHIAKNPKSVRALNPHIPNLLSNLVLKLLAKNAEDRYQSFHGVTADLERCLVYLQGSGERPAGEALFFELGRSDISQTFNLPQKLYGRSREISALLASFERAAAGDKELFIIAGNPGVGKSSLVAEVHKPITAKRGYFISGKFDQFQFNSPYSGFIQAFNRFVDALLKEPEAVLQTFRERITAALGGNGAVLTEFIPRLEDIIGGQPQVSRLDGQESRSRFNLVFQKFIGSICTAEHPLALFVDDWQWTDAASLELLKTIFADEFSRHLLVIIAYRDTEVGSSHPLNKTLSDIRAAGGRLNRIDLALLCESDINLLIADVLDCPDESAWPLTRIVYRTTRGNPFFNNQFLKALHAEGLIVFDFSKRCWICDITKVESLDLADDVVQFMVLRTKKLEPEIQDILKLAACIGNRFDLETLAAVYRRALPDTAAAVQGALEEGLLIPLVQEGDVPRYRFIHDRVQQAAYSLISDDQKTHVHFMTGRLMLERLPAADLDENIFEIVNQFNRAMTLCADPEMRIELAQLNFKAGQKAKAAAAYASAWSYLKISLELLPDDCWQDLYSFTLRMYEASVEAAFFSGDLEGMEGLVNVVLKEARSTLDAIRVYEVKILAFVGQNELRKAIDSALQVLKLLGMEFPEKPSRADILAGLQHTESTYRGKNIAELVDLPPMTEPQQLAAMRIMTSINPAAYLSAPELFAMLTFKQIRLSITYGNTPSAAHSYSVYGLLLCEAGKFEDGYQFGRLALELLRRLDAKEMQTRVYLIVYGLNFHYKIPLKEILAPLLSAYRSGLETGAYEFGGYAAVVRCSAAFYAGIEKDLTELEQEVSEFITACRKLKQTTVLQYFQMLRQVLHDLKRTGSFSNCLQGEYYDETVMMPSHLLVNDLNALFWIYAYKLLLTYLLGDYRQAIKEADQVQQYLVAAAGMPHLTITNFFDSLARLAECRVHPDKATDEALGKVAANQEKMKIWALHAPMNCQHKFDLVEAERQGLIGEKSKAIDYYDRAIAGAGENGYFRDEALANELAAGFYLIWGKEKIARDHLLAAYHGYLRWGATAKTDQLQCKYPELLAAASDLSGLQPELDKEKGPGVGTSDSLDLITVIKASQAIAGEIELERLLKQMMRIMFENAGAQRGALILKDGGKWVIQAQGEFDREIKVLQALKLRESGALSTEIVHEVLRTSAGIVLDNAAESGGFTDDPYVAENKIKSVICVPLINQGELTGILYLENNLATHAFKAGRLELLNLLSAQMALSLKNARLYQQAQIEIAERKAAEESLLESEQKFKTIFDSVNDAIFVFEISSGKLLDVNNTMCRMYGYTRKEALKLGIGDLSWGEYPFTEKEARQWARKTTAETARIVEWMAKGNQGRLFWVEVTLRRAMIGGRYRMLVTARDITTRKEAEAQIEKLNQELEQRVIERTQQLEAANQELKTAQNELIKREKLAVLGKLTATVSHELRNPLGVMRSSNFYLQRVIKNQAPKVEKHFQRIEEQISLCNSIIEELIEYTSICGLSPKRYPLGPLMKEMVKRFKESDGIEITLDSAQNLRPVLHDHEKMKRVMRNLLTNAVQAVNDRSAQAAENGCPYQPEVAIDVTQQADTMVIRVRDNGIGMSEAVCQKAFEPLFTTRARGTGIGLAIVKKIIEEHGGSITIESRLDQWTQVTFTLPATP